MKTILMSNPFHLDRDTIGRGGSVKFGKSVADCDEKVGGLDRGRAVDATRSEQRDFVGLVVPRARQL